MKYLYQLNHITSPRKIYIILFYKSIQFSWGMLVLLNICYITHKNIPVILFVNPTPHDIKYYAFIPNIWREGKVPIKMDISLVLRDIVGILPISLMPTLIVWLLLVLVFIDSNQNFWYKFYQIENLGFKLVSDGDPEILLDNADDANTNKLIKYVLTHSFRSLPVIMQLSLC